MNDSQSNYDLALIVSTLPYIQRLALMAYISPQTTAAQKAEILIAHFPQQVLNTLFPHMEVKGELSRN